MKIPKKILHINKVFFFVASFFFLFAIQMGLLKKGFVLKPYFFDIPSLVVLFSVAALKILSHDENGLQKSIFRFVYIFMLKLIDCSRGEERCEVANLFRLIMWLFFSSMFSWVAVLAFGGRW